MITAKTSRKFNWDSFINFKGTTKMLPLLTIKVNYQVNYFLYFRTCQHLNLLMFKQVIKWVCEGGWAGMWGVCVSVLSCSVVSHSFQPPSLSMGFFPGKNTEADCCYLLQGIFPTQGLKPCLLHLLHWQMDLLPLSHLGSPTKYTHSNSQMNVTSEHIFFFFVVNSVIH